jgi:hypothetical protein
MDAGKQHRRPLAMNTGEIFAGCLRFTCSGRLHRSHS